MYRYFILLLIASQAGLLLKPFARSQNQLEFRTAVSHFRPRNKPSWARTPQFLAAQALRKSNDNDNCPNYCQRHIKRCPTLCTFALYIRNRILMHRRRRPTWRRLCLKQKKRSTTAAQRHATKTTNFMIRAIIISSRGWTCAHARQICAVFFCAFGVIAIRGVDQILFNEWNCVWGSFYVIRHFARW